MGKHLYPLALHPITPDQLHDLFTGTPPEERRGQLYIHLPFCESICTFCLIQKYQAQASSPVAQYVAALKSELEEYSRLPYIRLLRFNSVYFGGGTPSVLEDRYLAEIFDLIHKRFRLEAPQQTFEGNVQSLTRDKIRLARQLGFNRLSAGAQTFDPGLRRALNLVPTFDDVRQCVNNGRAEGFDDLNLDLMFNLPGQTSAIWERDLQMAAGLEPSGLDVFETVVAKNTPLYGQLRRGDLPDERDPATHARNYELAEDILAASGYEQKNLYVWTRRGFRNELMDCQDRLRDQELDIVGAGLSSYSYINGTAFFNEASLSAYIGRVRAAGCAAVSHYRPTREQRMVRFMVMSLQTFLLDRERFATLFHQSMDATFGDALRSCTQRGLITPVPTGYRLTRLGRAWASTMAVEFYDSRYIQDVMLGRLHNRIAPGLTLEEEYDHIVFALFHPDIMIKGKMNISLLWRYLRLLQRGEQGWLARLVRSLTDRLRTYRRVPVLGFLTAGWHLIWSSSRQG
jgi:oxygen-independent coproporphyrinogen-3 oxidase